jgi:hypothetical protein
MAEARKTYACTIEFSTVRLHYSSAVNPLALSRQGSPPARDSQRREVWSKPQRLAATHRPAVRRTWRQCLRRTSHRPSSADLSRRVCGKGERLRDVCGGAAPGRTAPTPLPHTGSISPGNYCMTATDPTVSFCRHPGNLAPVRRSNIVFRIQLVYGLQCPFPLPNPPRSPCAPK